MQRKVDERTRGTKTARQKETNKENQHQMGQVEENGTQKQTERCNKTTTK